MKSSPDISFYGQFFLVLCLCLFCATETSAKTLHQYTVEIDKDLKDLQVKACFAGSLPKQLINYDENAQYHLKHVVLTSGDVIHRLSRHGNSISLAGIKTGECVHYAVNFRDQTTHPWFKSRQASDRQIVLDIHQWLWFPQPFDVDKHGLKITFKLPEGMNISTPWPLISRGKGFATYAHDLRPADWEGRIAIGYFKTQQRTIGDADIHIALLNARTAYDSEAILQWVNTSLDALMLAYGEFPVPNLQLLVVPVGKDREPVPWGQAMRGGGDAVHVYIDQTRPLQEFFDDWVLVHELSHLLHPWITKNDAWLYEGLASYYQNVLRARAGLLSPQAAWEQLHQGFQRGIRGTPRDRTLQQVTETMSRDRAFMRVYWSGAAISLLADYQLRSQSKGEKSLDDALAKFHRCCLPAGRQWSGREVMERLDSLTQTRVFTKLYEQHVPSTEFPVLAAVYDDLGLVERDEQITFRPGAKAEKIRQGIMSPTQ